MSCTQESRIIYYSELDSNTQLPDPTVTVGAAGKHIYEVNSLTAEQVKCGAVIYFCLKIVQPDSRSVTIYYAIDTSRAGKVYENSEEMWTDAWIDYV